MIGSHSRSRRYGADAVQDEGKCCLPNLDCSEFRAYAAALGTYLLRGHVFVHEPSGHEMWLNTVQLWTELFIPLEETATTTLTENLR
ncbi:MAG: hypothetical protein WA790_02240 [Sulfitobacter sp.]